MRTPWRTLGLAALTLVVSACSDNPDPTDPGGPNGPDPLTGVAFITDSIRTAFDLPALAGAIVRADAPNYARGVAGDRRQGGPAAGLQDLWHIGSNFKALTGILAAIAVDMGDIAWTSTIADGFPELDGSIAAEYADVTLLELLSHQSGLPRDPPGHAIIGMTGTAQRNSVSAWAVTQPPASARGTYSYTNVGYMVAGAMLERALGTTFEEAMGTHVFTPLGMDDAGFGPQAPQGSTDQPVAHTFSGGTWVVREGYDLDPAYASAGGAHMSMDSWSRFLQEVLLLEQGDPSIVSVEAGTRTTASIVTESESTAYGMGWRITNRGWAGGRVLWHGGSNLGNHSVAWVAPLRGFAVLGVTNAYDGTSSQTTFNALDALVGRLITLYETGR